MRVFKQIQDSTIFVEGEGAFGQTGVVFSANGPDNVIMTVNGDEVFDEAWADIQDEAGAAAGIDQAAVLAYLDDQKVPVRVAATWVNTDIITNLNTGNTDFFGQLVPLVANNTKESELFTRVDDNVFQTEFFGEILINVNIHLTSAGQRAAMQSRIIRDPLGTPSVEGPICSTGYIRNTNGHAEASLNYTHITGVGVGNQFAVGIRRESTVASDVTMRFASSSNIQIARLR